MAKGAIQRTLWRLISRDGPGTCRPTVAVPICRPERPFISKPASSRPCAPCAIRPTRRHPVGGARSWKPSFTHGPVPAWRWKAGAAP